MLADYRCICARDEMDGWHDGASTGINAKRTITTDIQDSTLTRTTLNGANVTIGACI